MAIIIGSKKKAYGKDSKNDIDILIKKIREKLEDSPVAILPFIESCTRNAHLIQSSAKQLTIIWRNSMDIGNIPVRLKLAWNILQFKPGYNKNLLSSVSWKKLQK